MDELRMVRREDQSLILASDAGKEYRLIVDRDTLTEIRALARQLTGGAKVNPRQIQTLVRAGKSRQEIIELTGADESDIDRYEEPVLAERRHILSVAQAVPVRTSPAEPANQKFGGVIAERLIGLAASNIEWLAWRDEEAGWMIGLEFEVSGASHRAVWSFDHRKSLLAPVTPEAVNLSKQGDLGDRLIPKLRAVDSSDDTARFDSGAFDHEQLAPLPEDDAAEPATDHTADAKVTELPRMSTAAQAALKARHPSTGSIPVIADDDDFARRKEIDQLAVKTDEESVPDLGQTADLLDALRRRRGERDDADQAGQDDHAEAQHSSPVVPLRGQTSAETDLSPIEPVPADEPQALPKQLDSKPPVTPVDSLPPEPKKSAKGRPSIPSWDDILFGTRSEEDPS